MMILALFLCSLLSSSSSFQPLTLFTKRIRLASPKFNQSERSDDSSSDSEKRLIESVFSSSQQDQSFRPEIDEQPIHTLDDVQKADIHLPTTGISVSDALMEVAERSDDVTEFIQVSPLSGVAQIVTRPRKSPAGASLEPIRYIVALSPPQTDSATTYVLTDLPPYSDELAANIRKFLGRSGKLKAILLTSRTGVYYDQGPGVFTTRVSHLRDWLAVFPDVQQVVAYRLDVPRDCASLVTQKLNGYGPWAWNSDTLEFEETGRPLITKEWDAQTIRNMLQKGLVPPSDEAESGQESDDGEYSPAAIRKREEGKQILAVYTPGHTYGTLSYVFPETSVVVSGFTIPIEDFGSINEGQDVGPSLDVRGYITTSTAGTTKQMESARHLVNTYGDRFGIVLPARNDPLFLDEVTEKQRRNVLLRIIDQYDKVGRIYSKLGIHSDGDEGDER
jgi:hypothetical protein